jgi:uncharacterized RDD family membrane protein YckC
MGCQACGYTVSDQAIKCPACGADPRTGLVPERVLALERERQKAHPQSFAFVHSFTPWTVRLGATWIDMIVVLVPWGIFVLMLIASIGETKASQVIGYIYFLFLFAYFVLIEGIVGRTVGKMLAGAYVLRFDGERIGLGRSLVRNLFKMPGLGMSPFTLYCIVSNKNHQRLGDGWAGTIVVQDTPKQVQQRLAELKQETVSAPAGPDTTT